MPFVLPWLLASKNTLQQARPGPRERGIRLEPIIRVEGLTHTYGQDTPFCRSAVDGVSLEIYRGEFLGIIGHTGSGKSTLIQHLNGLLQPTVGKIYLDGRDIWADPKKIRDVRFRVGLVFQYPE